MKPEIRLNLNVPGTDELNLLLLKHEEILGQLHDNLSKIESVRMRIVAEINKIE